MSNVFVPYSYSIHIIWGLYAINAMLIDINRGLIGTAVSVVVTWLLAFTIERVFKLDYTVNNKQLKEYVSISTNVAKQFVILGFIFLAAINVSLWYKYHLFLAFVGLLLLVFVFMFYGYVAALGEYVLEHANIDD